MRTVLNDPSTLYLLVGSIIARMQWVPPLAYFLWQ